MTPTFTPESKEVLRLKKDSTKNVVDHGQTAAMKTDVLLLQVQGCGKTLDLI